MTRLFMGRMSDGYPALRIMKNDADDPLTTLSTAYAKFIFDSRSTKLNYIMDIFSLSFDPAYPLVDYPGQNYKYPSTSSWDNCQIMIHSQQSDNVGTWQEWRYFKEFFETFSDSFGMMEVRAPAGTGLNEFKGPGSYFSLPNTGWPDSGLFGGAGSDPGYYSFTRDFTPGTLKREAAIVTIYNFNRPLMVSVVDLPNHNDPIPNQNISPVSGQKAVYISQAAVNVALPGFDAENPDFRKFIVHKDRVPAKIVKAGEISLPKDGTATINSPMPLTLLTYMDFHARTTTTNTQDDRFWNPPYFGSPQPEYGIRFSYKVLAQSVELVNRCNYNLVIRYMICADSDQPYTTGGSQVFRTVDDGVSAPYVQFKRPGSSDAAPNFNDIILDSRLSYVPILKEGYLLWPGDFPTNATQSPRFRGEKKTTIQVSNPDNLLLMVKQNVCFPRNKPLGQTYTSICAQCNVFVNSGGTWSGRTDCWSSTAMIAPDNQSVDFYMSGGNPFSVSGGGNDPDYPTYPAEGMRYYIFGIKPTA